MTQAKLYKRHRFPPEIIQYAVWLYHRFNLSHRDIEDLLAERSIEVSYDAIRLWCNKFGSKYAQRLRRKHQGYGDTFSSHAMRNPAAVVAANSIRFKRMAICLEWDHVTACHLGQT